VSTLYLAEALRTLGSGVVTATEADALKCAQFRANVKAAGVEAYVDLWEGDAFETVAQLEGTFDMVFIDVWANTYLNLFKQIERLLRPGSIVLADNMYTAENAVQPYKRYLDDDPRFSTTTLDFESGLEFTVVVS
jgi:predicted O-methyltransferase YrrM